MKGIISKAVVLALAALLSGAGCQAPGHRLVRVWCRTETLLPFVDRYNTIQNRYKVEVTFLAAPADELLIAQAVPDLILSDRLTAPRCAAKLEILSPLLHQGGLDEKAFYRGLLAAHRQKGADVALPFSFDLPVIVFNQSLYPKNPPRLISPEELKIAGGALNRADKTKTLSLGFSPLWNRDFLFHTATLFHVDFRAGADRTLAWDDQALEGWLGFISSWTDGQNGGFARETEFIRTYLYEPPYRLAGHPTAATRRIGFYHALASDFAAIPAAKRDPLGLAWLARDRKIPADPHVLFFGIPKGSANRVGAEDFLKWAFSPETQQTILTGNAADNPSFFGIGGAFSSLVKVNETFLPEVASFLRGRVPGEEEIIFSPPLPDTWEKTRDEALLPWIYDRLAGREGLPPLKTRLDQ